MNTPKTTLGGKKYSEGHGASGIIWAIICFEILKRYCRIVYESPVAKNTQC
jgi:hypothetical protein